MRHFSCKQKIIFKFSEVHLMKNSNLQSKTWKKWYMEKIRDAKIILL